MLDRVCGLCRNTLKVTSLDTTTDSTPGSGCHVRIGLSDLRCWLHILWTFNLIFPCGGGEEGSAFSLGSTSFNLI